MKNWEKTYRQLVARVQEMSKANRAFVAQDAFEGRGVDPIKAAKQQAYRLILDHAEEIEAAAQ
jgi:hypothetical protein